MKHIKRNLTGLLVAAALLCCACSAQKAKLPEPEPEVFSAVPLSAREAISGFSDIPVGAWYEEAAVWCRENGVVSGTTSTTFSPNETMTHAMLLTILYRADGTPSVNSEDRSWYGDAVAWSGEKGLTADYDNGHLDPNTPISREQIAAILWRYADSPAPGTAADYADESSIAAFAQTAVDWARSTGIMSGVGENRFNPRGTTTRAQTVAVLYRCLSGTADGGGAALSNNNPVVYMTTDISSEG